MMRALAFALFTLVCLLPAWANDVPEVLSAFKEYVTRSERFDQSLAELYSDDAAIRSRRLMPDGRTQNISFSGAQWKDLIRQAMPLAKSRGDRNTFRNISAVSQGQGVILTAERHSHLKGYVSPFAQTWRKDRTGAWKISAEVSETRP